MTEQTSMLTILGIVDVYDQGLLGLQGQRAHIAVDRSGLVQGESVSRHKKVLGSVGRWTLQRFVSQSTFSFARSVVLRHAARASLRLPCPLQVECLDRTEYRPSKCDII